MLKKNLLFTVLIVMYSLHCDAAVRYWVATSAGDWSDRDNWSTQSGGSGGATVPSASDEAVFNSLGAGICYMDVNVSLRRLELTQNFNGSIVQTDKSITIGDRHFKIKGGSFVGGSGSIICNGDFLLDGGSFMSTSGTLSIRQKLEFLNGSFFHNDGLVHFKLAVNSTFKNDLTTNDEFYDVLVEKPSGNELVINGGHKLKVLHRIDLLSGELNGGDLYVQGICYVHPTWEQGDTRLTFYGNGLSEYHLDAMNWTMNSIVLDKSTAQDSLIIIDDDGDGMIALGMNGESIDLKKGVLTFETGISVDFDFEDVFIQSSAALVSTEGSLTLMGNYTNLGGLFEHNEGTLVFDGVNNIDFRCDNTPTDNFFNVVLALTDGDEFRIATGDTLHASNELWLSEGKAVDGVLKAAGDVNIETGFDGGDAALIFTGSANQHLTSAGTYDHFIAPILIDKSNASYVELLTPFKLMEQDQSLELHNGNLITSALNLLTIGSQVVCRFASESSYIEGPMRKIGKESFQFPIGKSSFYAPITITAPDDGDDAFTAEYFPENPHPLFNTASRASTLNSISTNEYWILDRTAGDSEVSVTLSWGLERSGVIEELSELVVTRWNGSEWQNHGNLSPSNGQAMEPFGFVQTNQAVTNFSPFTLAFRTPTNPLPVEWLGFKATALEHEVNLEWSTGAEINNDYFEVERSADGMVWETISSVQGAGNSSSQLDYDAIDRYPIKGLSYYRIKQVDYDGQFDYSTIEVVDWDGLENEGIIIYPNPSNGIFSMEGFIQSSEDILLYDVNGRELTSALHLKQLTEMMTVVEIDKIPEGIYLLYVDNRSYKIYIY